MRITALFLLLATCTVSMSQHVIRNPEATHRIAQFKLPAQRTEKELSLLQQKAQNKTNITYPINQYPASVVVPGEYEESQAACISWSYDYDNNGNPTVVDTFSEYGWISEQLANAIQPECPVWIRVKSAGDSVILKRYMASQGTPLYNCRFFVAPVDDWWIRDYGPIGFYYGAQDSLGFLDLKYYDGRDRDDVFPDTLANAIGISNYKTTMYAEGGNIMTDGWGKFFFSDVITSVNTDASYQSPPWTLNQTLDSLKRYFGAPELVKLKSLKCDGGTGHIDLYLKMIDEQNLMVMQLPGEVTALDKQLIEDNLQTIKTFNCTYNRPFHVYRIPMPTKDNGTIPKTCAMLNADARTYVNGLTLNKTFIYPTYSDNVDGNSAQDAEVEVYLKKIMPGYKMVGIDSRVISTGGGELHCITMQIPADNPIHLWHPSIEGYQPLQSKYHIVVKATNKSGMASVKCMWRKKGGSSYTALSLTDSSGYYIGDIPGTGFVASDEIQYYISASSNNGKSISKPIVAPNGMYIFFFTQRTGIDPVEVVAKNHLFAVSPNPVNGEATLQYQLVKSGFVQILVTDVTGRVMDSRSLQSTEGVHSMSLSAQGFAAGIYFCTLLVDGEAVITRRFIKE